MNSPNGVHLSENTVQKVKLCADLDSLLDTLIQTPYLSWIDIRLLEVMAVASGLVECKQLISNYKQSMFSIRLIDVLPNAPSKVVKDEYYTKLVTMVGKDDLTVADLLEFHDQFENVIIVIGKGDFRLEHLMGGKRVDKAMVNFMLEACRKGKTMKVRFGRVLFSGVSAAGKTNFYKLLLNKKFQARHISTGLHESERVSAMKIGMQCLDSHVQFIVLDFKKEIEELKSRLNILTKQPQQPEVQLTEQSQVEPSVAKVEMKSEVNLQMQLCGVELSMVESTVSSEKIINFVEDTWNILTFLDTGGQPEFINMLPAVNSCAMVTFIVHNMKNSLTSPVTVTHGRKDGEQSFKPYTIDCTNLQLIRSLISFTNNILLGRRPDAIFNKESIIKGNNTSYVSFIGTHSDCVPKEDINKLNSDLEVIVSDFQLPMHVWKRVHKDYKYLIPVDNTTAHIDDEDKSAIVIRNKLYDVLCEQNTYHVPIVWIILELEIRQICQERHNHAISYAEVVELCREKKLLDEEDDIKNGLRFHHLFGTLLYFEEVEEISDIIFTDLQWLFDKMTDIVKLSFDLSDVKASEDFERKGIFRPVLLDKINFTVEGFRGIGDPSRNFKESFLKLLEHLNIVAPMKQPNGIIEKYFMPCLLSNCSFDSDKSQCNFLTTYDGK